MGRKRTIEVQPTPPIPDALVESIQRYWREDRLPGLRQNTYTLLMNLSAGEREQARHDDYVRGFLDGHGGMFNNVKRALDRYGHVNHGVIVDLAVYQLGYERGIAIANSME